MVSKIDSKYFIGLFYTTISLLMFIIAIYNPKIISFIFIMALIVGFIVYITLIIPSGVRLKIKSLFYKALFMLVMALWFIVLVQSKGYLVATLTIFSVIGFTVWLFKGFKNELNR
jgi:hypothetical protein